MTAPAAEGRGLWRWSVFAAVIGAAGLPIYIHAPKFYAESYGVELATMGVVLALLRLTDVVQDPLLGWLAEALRHRRAGVVAGATAILVIAMLCLFAVFPPLLPLVWFALSLGALFTAFSLLTILFYAQAVERGAALGPAGHLSLAGWREAGSLIGISLAAMAPFLLGPWTDRPFAAFAIGFAGLAAFALFAMRGAWGQATAAPPPRHDKAVQRFRPILADPVARRLLVISVVNAAPVAVTSTLFLFFVESRLGAPDWAGPLLLLFFLSAAGSAPIWSRLAARFGEKPVLLSAMAIAIASFVWALVLGTGDLAAFAVICVVSGAAMAADMTLLPALFARRLAQLNRGGESAAFGLWSFAAKLSLALAAAALLPTLQASGFRIGEDNDQRALWALSLLYAGLPCLLKLIAAALMLRSDLTLSSLAAPTNGKAV